MNKTVLDALVILQKKTRVCVRCAFQETKSFIAAYMWIHPDSGSKIKKKCAQFALRNYVIIAPSQEQTNFPF